MDPEGVTGTGAGPSTLPMTVPLPLLPLGAEKAVAKDMRSTTRPPYGTCYGSVGDEMEGGGAFRSVHANARVKWCGHRASVYKDACTAPSAANNRQAD
jgi:hypothetical protein